ncbi:metallophosphoesterase [Microbacterium sp. Marseille-Q6648]|uniref:metallophosphoesterase family protein n=1 Tax=Microbacterium sp. Marseille-Q6648 TaxID=2937991 RepID=UPI002041EEBC|nr:metallophosphoesterase [Microbacterium sp. Marseille-Q6648]
MRVWETADSIDLPAQRVAVCGDWHGNTGWIRRVARAISRIAPGMDTILQAGDWWTHPERSDDSFLTAGITRVYVTLGNHEPWNQLTPLLDAHPGHAVRVSAVTWILPRPYRLTIGGRRILSLGGATSVDRRWRTEGRDWWPDEEITDAHVAAAIAGGPADIMITHESPAHTPVRAVGDSLRINPLGLDRDTLAASAASRRRITDVFDAVRPELLLHGHMHAPGGGITADGRRVISLGCDGQYGHASIVDLHRLHIHTLTLHDIRTAGAPPA